MKPTSRVCCLVVLVGGLAGCGSSVTAPTPRPASAPLPAVPPTAPPPVNPIPAFLVADVTLSGTVFEVTADGRRPIEGVEVANGDGNYAKTDRDGYYSMRPVWTCPCQAQPSLEAGLTFLWVDKAGYTAPPGTPASLFGQGLVWSSARDVKIDGDTTFDIELVRR
jgi:hypothetical protein